MISGTSAGERIEGNTGPGSHDDDLRGLGGNDVLTGFDGDDLLSGGTGDDRLDGGTGDDSLDGGDGNDSLFGGDGADVLDGGAGDDDLDGGFGADTYRPGAGVNRIVETGADGEIDRIVLAAGIALTGVGFTRSLGGDIILAWFGGSVLIAAGFEARSAVERLETSDGASLDILAQVYVTSGTSAADRIDGNTGLGSHDDDLRGLGGNDILVGADGDDQLSGGAGDDILHGDAGADRIDGGDGNDALFGSDGADRLDGGAGDDLLDGGSGGDTYLPGSGANRITDDGADGDAPDRILLPIGVTVASVTFARGVGGALLLGWAGGSLVIDAGLATRSAIEILADSNGATLSIPDRALITTGTSAGERIDGNTGLGLRDDDLRGEGGDDQLHGFDGDDRLAGGADNDDLDGGAGADLLDGGAGNDTLRGGSGGDLYVVGTGFDSIIESGAAGDADDSVRIDVAGLTLAGISFGRSAVGDLYLTWSGGAHGVRIERGLTGTSAIERLQLGLGTPMALATQAFAPYEPPADLRFTGGAGDDSFTGGAGNDVLIGNDGDDRLAGGPGADRLEGGNGDDSFVVSGDDIVTDTGGADRIELPAGVTLAGLTMTRTADGDLRLTWPGGSARILAGLAAPRAVEIIVLADGTTTAVAALAFETLGTGAADILAGNLEALGPRTDVIRGLDGDDIVLGHDGDDWLDGGNGNDRLEGGGEDDRLDGGDGRDTLLGAAGNDRLDGGLGDDRLEGGLGDDFYRVAGNDLIVDTGGNDSLQLPGEVTTVTATRLGDGDLVLRWATGSVRIDQALDSASAIETLIFGGLARGIASLVFETLGTDEAETLAGNQGAFGSHSDIIRGLDGNDSLLGLDGNDTLDGGLGDDRLEGGSGDDGLLGGGGNDMLMGGDGSDRLTGGAGDDWLDGGLGDDVYIVLQNDLILDSGGADRILLPTGVTAAAVTVTRLGTGDFDGDLVVRWAHGSVRIDAGLDGSRGVELLAFGDGTIRGIASFAFETLGSDEPETLHGNQGALGSRDDVIRAFDGDDIVFGRDGNDRLDAGAGNDRLDGGTSDDLLSGGAGDDTLEGGDGDDTAIFDGRRGDFSIVTQGLVTVVVDLRVGAASGTDTLTGIERLRFSDLDVAVELPPPAIFSIAAAAADRAEGAPGDATPFTFTLTRIGSLAAAHVDVTLTGAQANAATSDDFVGGFGSPVRFAFADGETARTVTVTVAGDAGIESDEGFTVALSGVSPGSIIAIASTTGIIGDDDTALFGITAVAADTAEGADGVATPFVFTVTRSGNLAAAEVDVTLTGAGPNPAGFDDFVTGFGAPARLRFAAGERTRTVTVNIAGDTALEADEGFAVTLTPAGNSVIGAGNVASAIIRNDDTPDFSILPIAVDRAEGQAGVTPYTFAVIRTGPLAAASVDVTLTGSGASPAMSEDFSGGFGAPMALVFAAGEAARIVTVSVAGDSVFEADESFVVALSAASAGSGIAVATAGGVIRNDDSRDDSIDDFAGAALPPWSADAASIIDQALSLTGPADLPPLDLAFA